MTEQSKERGGYYHVHSLAELRAYRALPADVKLQWLHAMWQLNVDFLRPHARRLHERFRRGDL